MTPAQVDRFIAKIYIDSETGCWIWTGSKHPTGYGQFNLVGKRIPGRVPARSHRVAYEHWVGPIPEGKQVHHNCENVACCYPRHLEALTPKEHSQRGYWANLTVCHKRGHPLTPENTIVDGNGWRRCRTCSRENARKNYHKRKAALA